MTFWIYGLIFSCAIQYGLAIMCYECNSMQNSQCRDKILHSSLVRNCSEYDRTGIRHNQCRKAVQIIEQTINGQQPSVRTIRSCGWDESKYKGQCYHRSGYGGRQDVCSCTTNYCNESHKIESYGRLYIAYNMLFLFTINLIYL